MLGVEPKIVVDGVIQDLEKTGLDRVHLGFSGIPCATTSAVTLIFSRRLHIPNPLY